MKTSSYLLAALVLATACSDGGKKMIKPPVDAPIIVDGPPPCSAPMSFTAASDLALFYNPDSQTMVTGNQEVFRTIGDINADPSPDWLWIELFEGPAPDYTTENFPATPFTINLTGNELDYLKCSTCITLTTDVNLANMNELEYLDDYMASSGSVTITTLTPPDMTTTPPTPGMIAGTLTDINFVDVDISMAGTVPTSSGCTSTLSTLSFSAMTMASAVNGSVGARVSLGKGSFGKRPLRQ